VESQGIQLIDQDIDPPVCGLDDAAIAASGWKSDLSDEEILEKLLALNPERAK